MTADQLHLQLNAVPFIPFTLHLANGKSFRVDHPDFAMLTHGGRILITGLEGDTAAHVDLMLATHLEAHPPVSTNAQG